MSDTLTIKAKLDIIDWHISHGGGHKSRTARHFSQVLQRDIQANRVGERLMAEESIRQKAEQAKHRPDAKMVRQPKTGAAVAVLDTWIEAATEAKLILSSELICVRYQAICNELGISLAERAVMSKSWLQGRKNTHGLQLRKRHGEAASAKKVVVLEERKRLEGIAKDYPLRDIFNMDETGLFYS